MMASMPATSASQEVARRLRDDGYVVVTGLLTPDGASTVYGYMRVLLNLQLVDGVK